MWRELEGLRGSTGLLDETRDHDREVERMRDEYLADGCAVQDFSDKVNRLIKDHVPHLERPLAGAKLGGFIIRLMPRCNAAEGRALHRELEAAGTLGTVPTVVRRCVEIVKSSQAPGAHAAAAAVRRARPAAAAIPALADALSQVSCAVGPHRHFLRAVGRSDAEEDIHLVQVGARVRARADTSDARDRADDVELVFKQPIMVVGHGPKSGTNQRD